MSNKELNSYRFSPEQEPTDEMLEQIMREVAEEAKESRGKGKQSEGNRTLLRGHAQERIGEAG